MIDIGNTGQYDYILYKIGLEEILAQLSEEASELAQAALKLRRAMNENNPTTVTLDAAYSNLIEEYADTMLCLKVGKFTNTEFYDKSNKIMEEKTKRWCERLRDKA